MDESGIALVRKSDNEKLLIRRSHVRRNLPESAGGA